MRASDAPHRTPGGRARAGNAMSRTRGALLQAASTCVARYGVKRTTMSDIAAVAQVAKATLYNHFRTKDDVLTALVEAEVTALVAACLAAARGDGARPGSLADGLGEGTGQVRPLDLPGGLAAALALAATLLAGSPPLRVVAVQEPALLGPLLTPSEAPGWRLARGGTAEVLRAAGLPGDALRVSIVLRWLLGGLAWPQQPEQIRAGALALARALAGGSPGLPDVEPPGEAAGQPATAEPASPQPSSGEHPPDRPATVTG